MTREQFDTLTGGQRWDLLTALRGPDADFSATAGANELKLITTLPIRGVVLPALNTPFLPALGSAAMTFEESQDEWTRLSACEQDAARKLWLGSDHFRRHICSALAVLLDASIPDVGEHCKFLQRELRAGLDAICGRL